MNELILTGIRNKFKNARELCPGMSEEIYILTDYMGAHTNDELVPSGMSMLFLLVMDDLSNGRCGFHNGGSVPEAFIMHRDQIMAQFCYILQVIDAIADPEYADAVREDCQKSFGWNVPKQVKINDQLSYPPYVMAAVDWWTNAVQHPKMDNGDSTMSMLMAMLGGGSLAKDFTEAEMSAFRSTLAEGIKVRLDNGLNFVRLCVDYGPEGVLAEAGQAANMGGFAFPCKTRMEVSPTLVRVAAGYGASYETIWQA